MSVNPNLLYLFPQDRVDTWDSVFEISLCKSKSTSDSDLPDGAPVCLLSIERADSVKTKSRLSGLYFTGLLKTILQFFREEIERPSTKVPWFLYSLSKLFQRSCFDKTLAFPKMIRPYFALVRATLSLLGSLRKPIPEASLDLTHEKRMKSFSRPQNESTEATSISLQKAGSSCPCLAM